MSKIWDPIRQFCSYPIILTVTYGNIPGHAISSPNLVFFRRLVRHKVIVACAKGILEKRPKTQMPEEYIVVT